MHDDFESISAIVERLVKGLAPAGEEGSAGAARDGGTGGTAIMLEFPGRRTGAAARGPYMPPRQAVRDRTPDNAANAVTAHGKPPATGGLGDARKREGR